MHIVENKTTFKVVSKLGMHWGDQQTTAPFFFEIRFFTQDQHNLNNIGQC